MHVERQLTLAIEFLLLRRNAVVHGALRHTLREQLLEAACGEDLLQRRVTFTDQTHTERT